MLHLLQMGPFKVLTTLGSFHFWSCPPCCVPASSRDPTPTNTVSSSLDSFSFYTFTVQSGPFGSPFANASLPPHTCLQTFILLPSLYLPAAPSPPFHVLIVFLYFLLSLPPLTPSGFFNGMLDVSKPGALSYYTLSCLMLLTSVSRNSTLTHLPLSRYLDSLLRSDCTYYRSGILFVDDTHARGSIILSGRA